MPICFPEDEDLHLLQFADLLGRDQCSTEMDESGVTIIRVGDSGKLSAIMKKKKKLIKNGLNTYQRAPIEV